MGMPQTLYIILIILELLGVSFLHGRPRRWNFWYALGDAILLTTILYWGGFFS